MIDKSLNWGRDQIRTLLKASSPFSSVLDIGAGTGVDLGIAHEICPQASLNAVEVYPPYATDLEKRRITVHRIDIERNPFPLPAESIDVVMANQILEHVKEIFWILDQSTRVLKTGGSLIIGLPNMASLHNRFLLAIGRQPTSIHIWSAHVRGYTASGFLDFLNVVCPDLFEPIEIIGGNFYPFPPFLARPLARLFPTMAVSIFIRLRKRRDYRGEFVQYASPGKLETNFFIGTY